MRRRSSSVRRRRGVESPAIVSSLTVVDIEVAEMGRRLMRRRGHGLQGRAAGLDRYGALESKLRSVQEGLELVLDVARDRRIVLLEGTVVLLIVTELTLSLLR